MPLTSRRSLSALGLLAKLPSCTAQASLGIAAARPETGCAAAAAGGEDSAVMGELGADGEFSSGGAAVSVRLALGAARAD